MLKEAVAAALVTISGCALNAQQTSNKLALVIPDLYGPQGLKLPNQFHSAHFLSSFQQSFTPLNTSIASQLALLPFASPASGFVYSFNQAAGVYTRSSESFGPVLVERGETIGKHKLFVGAAYQYFSFSSLDGLDLKKLPAVFRHEQQTGQPYERDFITTNNSIDLKINQFTGLATFGLTDRVDVSIAIPVVNAHLGVTSDATIQRIAPPSPQFGQAHFFDPANPEGSTRHIFASNRNASGIGDVTLRGKATLLRGEQGALALAADLRLPTGDEYNFLGTGAWGFRPFLIGSYRIGRVAPHVNAGYEWNGRTVLAGNVGTGAKGRLPNQFTYAAGADIGATRRLTLAGDIIGQHVFAVGRVSRGTFTDVQGRSFPELVFERGGLDIVNGSAGVKIGIARTLLLTANAIFKLNDAGLRADVIPLIGLSYTF